MNLSQIRLMNAAGWIKRDGPSFRNLLRSPVTDIVFGSITVPKRPGTTGTNFVVEDDFSVNSLGLPNDGLAEYERSLPPLITATHRAQKKFRLSIAPLCLEDCTLLAAFATRMRVDTLELNLGCPNVHSEGKQKPIFAYDLDLAGGALTRVADEWKGPLAIKLSPYNGKTMEMFAKRIAALINRQPRHFQPGDSVVVCNTLPNFAPQNEQGAPLLRAIGADGQIITAGGMGGRRLLPHALKDVLRFRKWLPSDIAIDAVGGIETGKDVLTYHTVGATGFQIGTAYFKNDDPRIFSRVLEELA